MLCDIFDNKKDDSNESSFIIFMVNVPLAHHAEQIDFSAFSFLTDHAVIQHFDHIEACIFIDEFAHLRSCLEFSIKQSAAYSASNISSTASFIC